MRPRGGTGGRAGGMAAGVLDETGQEKAGTACAELAAGWDGLEDLRIALAIAAADLDDAIAEHTGILHP
jgi:hypothetical protein